MSNMERACVVCHHSVEEGVAHYYNFTTGEYRHRSCGLDHEAGRETGRERLVRPPSAPQKTPGTWGPS